MFRITLLTLSVAVASAATVVSSSTGNQYKHDRPASAQAAAASSAPSFSDIAGIVELEMTDQLHGIARPSQQADLPSLVRGTINTIHVQEGESVQKGSPLITIDDRVPRARLMAAEIKANLTGALSRAEVRFRIAESRCHRMQAAMQRGAAADFELEEAVAARDEALAAVNMQRDILKAAEAEREMAEAQLAQYTISAPFNGMIIEIHQRSGTVDLSVPVITIVSLETLEVELHLPSRMFGTIQRGEQVELRASEPVSRIIPARVLSVSPIINSASRTFRCLLHMDNSTGEFPAGFSTVLNTGERPGDPDQPSRTASISPGEPHAAHRKLSH